VTRLSSLVGASQIIPTAEETWELVKVMATAMINEE